MLNEKRTQRIMKSKFLIFLSAVAMLLLFSNCGSKTTSNDQATTEVKDTVTSKEEAVPDSVSILGDQVYDSSRISGRNESVSRVSLQEYYLSGTSY